MKKLLIIVFVFLSVMLSADMIEEFKEFQRDISRQTAKFQNSALHKQIKANRETREYVVGDTKIFWAWDFSVMPPLWIQTPATCRAVGDHCYIFVADDQWNLNMDQTDIDIILPYLEDYTMISTEWGAIEMDETLFGPIPDELDNDPKIIVYYSALGSYMGTSFDGYFSAYNQVTEAEAQQMNPSGHSNECEMIYMTCYPLNPTEPIRISVLAHELQHMIHWLGDVNEDTWVNEGCSELAMVYFGLPDPILTFPNNPDNSLNVWDQEFADYVKVMLYFTYLEEQYDAVGDSLIKDIVSEPLNGIAGITNQLVANSINQPFEDIFVDWTIANFLDDPEVENGHYYYENLNLPNFHAIYTHSAYPAGNSGNINAWATDYIRLYPGEGNLELTLTTNFPIGLGVMRLGMAGVTTTVDKYTINGNWSGLLPELTADYSQMILSFANNGYSNASYSYSIDDDIFHVENIPNSNDISISCYPNPFTINSNYISFSINSFQIPLEKIEIFNVKGQKVKEIPSILPSTNHSFTVNWDGKDENGRLMGNGVYFYKATIGEKEFGNQFIIMR
ncbi:MAG: T9SS type A sorting domain-containing protein [Candidatus Cloacimonadota bacterium]|nr:T9SS type A sorting domain-containing protein [Candidatus Cloacimonadota bacterium]